jgi:preprotein translocase SecE subunit
MGGVRPAMSGLTRPWPPVGAGFPGVHMALGLYKPGQGYLVRVMAAGMAGMIVLAASAWLWMQVGAIDFPYGSYRVGLGGMTAGAATPAPGTPLELMGDPATAGATPIGTAAAAAFEGGGGANGTLVITDVKIADKKYDASMTRSLRTADGAFAANVSGTAQGIPVVEPVYVQAASVGVLMLVGSVLTYWLVGLRASTVEFLIATDGEMKKVNWSSWKDIRGSTLVVIFASFLIAAGLFGVDFVFSAFFKLIGVLQQ